VCVLLYKIQYIYVQCSWLRTSVSILRTQIPLLCIKFLTRGSHVRTKSFTQGSTLLLFFYPVRKLRSSKCTFFAKCLWMKCEECFIRFTDSQNKLVTLHLIFFQFIWKRKITIVNTCSWLILLSWSSMKGVLKKQLLNIHIYLTLIF